MKINLRNQVASLAPKPILYSFIFPSLFYKIQYVRCWINSMWIFNYVRWVSGCCSKPKWPTLHNRNIFASNCVHRTPCIAVYWTGWIFICGIFGRKLKYPICLSLFASSIEYDKIICAKCKSIAGNQFNRNHRIRNKLEILWNINPHWQAEQYQNGISNRWPKALFKSFQGFWQFVYFCVHSLKFSMEIHLHSVWKLFERSLSKVKIPNANVNGP